MVLLRGKGSIQDFQYRRKKYERALQKLRHDSNPRVDSFTLGFLEFLSGNTLFERVAEHDSLQARAFRIIGNRVSNIRNIGSMPVPEREYRKGRFKEGELGNEEAIARYGFNGNDYGGYSLVLSTSWNVPFDCSFGTPKYSMFEGEIEKKKVSPVHFKFFDFEPISSSSFRDEHSSPREKWQNIGHFPKIQDPKEDYIVYTTLDIK